MSSVLQEIGFDPEDIRVVLDERATGAAIRERIDWLLEGTADRTGTRAFLQRPRDATPGLQSRGSGRSRG